MGMAKKKKLSVYVIVLIVLLIAVGGFFVFRESGIVPQNFNIFSITSPIVVSTNPNLASYNFRIRGSLGGGERIVGEIPVSNPDYTGTKPITISASGITETFTYSIQRDMIDRVYRLEYVTTKATNILSYAPPCPSGGFVNLGEEEPILGFNIRHCIRYAPIGYHGNLQNPARQFKAEITVSNGDKPITKNITDKDRVITFSDFVIMRLDGALLTGDPLPIVVSDYKPVLVESGNWYFIRQDDWTGYLVQTENGNWINTFKSQLNDPRNSVYFGSGSSMTTYIDGIVKQKNQAIYSLVSKEVTFGGGAWKNRDGLDNAQLSFPLKSTFAKETFTMDVRADWVGIEKLSSKPVITQLSCPKFESANEGTLYATIKNDGDSDAKFFVSTTGCSPISQKFSAESESVYLTSGSSTITPIEIITGNINADVSKTCTVKVYDSADPSLFDIETVTCQVTKVAICTPEGREYINIQKDYCLDVCQSGDIIKEYKCCDSNTQKLEFVSDGKYKCVAKGTPPPPPPPDCKPLLDWMGLRIDNPFCGLKQNIMTVSIIAGLLSALFVFFIGKNNFMPKKRKKDNMNLVLIGAFSIIAGFLVFFLVKLAFDFVFSFWGIVTIILVVILMVAFNSIKAYLGLR